MWEKFCSALPSIILMKLAMIRLDDEPGVLDEVSWNGRMFTVMSLVHEKKTCLCGRVGIAYGN